MLSEQHPTPSIDQMRRDADSIRRIWRGARATDHPRKPVFWYPDPVRSEDQQVDLYLTDFAMRCEGAAPANRIVDHYLQRCEAPSSGARHRLEQRLLELLRSGKVMCYTDVSIPDRQTVLFSTGGPTALPALTVLMHRGFNIDELAPAQLVLGACSVLQWMAPQTPNHVAARVLLLVHRATNATTDEQELALGAVRSARSMLKSSPRRACVVCGMHTRIAPPGFRLERWPCVVCGDDGAAGRPLWMRAAQRSIAGWRRSFVDFGASTPELAHHTRPVREGELPPGTLTLVSQPKSPHSPCCAVCGTAYGRSAGDTPVPCCECWLARGGLNGRCGEQPRLGAELWDLADSLTTAIGTLNLGSGLSHDEFGDLSPYARRVWPMGVRDGVDVAALASFGATPAITHSVPWRLEGRYVLPQHHWSLVDVLCPNPGEALVAAREVVTSLIARLDQLHATAGDWA